MEINPDKCRSKNYNWQNKHMHLRKTKKFNPKLFHNFSHVFITLLVYCHMHIFILSFNSIIKLIKL